MRLRRPIGFVAAAVFVLWAHFVPNASARDNGQWESAPPHVRRWFQGQKQPDHPNISCCGEADAYEADVFEVEDGDYVAVITDRQGRNSQRNENSRTRSQNEMGRGESYGARHIFLGIRGQVFCYVVPGGGLSVERDHCFTCVQRVRQKLLHTPSGPPPRLDHP
jgi:hypothetical protein